MSFNRPPHSLCKNSTYPGKKKLLLKAEAFNSSKLNQTTSKPAQSLTK